jgi:hypothetical protein
MAEASKKKFKVRKKQISEKQRLANIRNSTLSRGPVTTRGKNVCKYANLQHGLRAATVLPGEEDTYARRFAKWSEEWGVEGDSQGFMVHRAVMSSLRLDRSDVADAAMIDEHKDAVVNEADLRAGDDLDRLIGQLADSPAATIRRLRMTPIGCAWLREQFLLFKIRLRSHRSLLDSQRCRLCNLLGRRLEDYLCDDLTLVPYVVAMLGCLFGDEDLDIPSLAGVFGGQPEGMTATEFITRLRELGPMVPRDAKKANRMLRGLLTKELRKLRGQRALVEAHAAQTLEREVNRTRVALTPDGKQLEGYIRSERQSLDSSHRRVLAMQNPRQPRPPGRTPKPGPGPGDGRSPAERKTTVAASEPRAAQEIEAPAAVATEDRVAVAAEAPSGDCQPVVETTPDVPVLEPAGDGAIEPDEDKKTTRPILDRKSSPEAGFDEITTPADSGGGAPREPGAPEEQAGTNLPESEQIRGASKTPPQPPSIGMSDEPGSYYEPGPEAAADAGAKEPDFERYGPYAEILRKVQRNLQAADRGRTNTNPAERESPLIRATEQFMLRQAELARQMDMRFGINGERPEPGGAAPVADGSSSNRPEPGDSS